MQQNSLKLHSKVAKVVLDMYIPSTRLRFVQNKVIDNFFCHIPIGSLLNSGSLMSLEPIPPSSSLPLLKFAPYPLVKCTCSVSLRRLSTRYLRSAWAMSLCFLPRASLTMSEFTKNGPMMMFCGMTDSTLDFSLW